MKKKKTGAKKPAPPNAAPASKYPTGWYLMSRGDCTVQDLKAAFAVPGGPDVEVWRELGVVELSFPDGTFIDFQLVPCDLEGEASNAFLAEHQIRTLYWVTVEPVCDDGQLNFLQSAANRLGAMFCGGTVNFLPMLKPTDRA